MFVHEDLITIIFRLANFGLLVFTCVYIFKRYILPSILELMHQERDEQQRIKEQHKELDKQEKQLLVSAKEQEALVRLLKERIMRWVHEEQMVAQKKALAKEKVRMLYNERVAYQEQMMMRTKTLQLVVPQAVATVQNHFENVYALQKAQLEYIAGVIKVLNEEAQ